MSEQYPVLSVSRPWSTWIARGIKTIENRVWATNYRGPLWIHAAKSWDGDAFLLGAPLAGEYGSRRRKDHPLGIIAMVELTGICHYVDRLAGAQCECGPWAAEGQNHWRFADPRRLVEPIPASGRLGLWLPRDPDLRAQLAAAQFVEVMHGH